ncbi:tRNA pseudouridine synthase A [compost metagenome]
MQEGLALLLGTHDYTSFASRHSTKTSHVRTIYEAFIEIDPGMCRPGSDDQGVIHTFITGNGFLQHMVRIIMGTLIQVGEGKYPAAKVADILAACDRAAAGPTAVAKGLALWNVEYDEDWI